MNIEKQEDLGTKALVALAATRAKKKKRLDLWMAAVSLAGLGLMGCNLPWGAKLPAIAFDSNGEPTQVMVPESEVRKRLGASFSTTADSALLALQSSDIGHFSRGQPLVLRTASVGIGILAEVGVGPFKIGATPQFRLMFSNSKEPTIP